MVAIDDEPSFEDIQTFRQMVLDKFGSDSGNMRDPFILQYHLTSLNYNKNKLTHID